jgi:hypothetical protein
LYLENPQVAKTEDLLKFLPMVIEKLGADPDQLSEVPSESVASVKVPKKQAKRKTKIKSKTTNAQKDECTPKPKVMKREE